MPTRFLKYWDQDRSLTALLFLLALNLLVLSPASRMGKFVTPLTNASLVLLLLAGIRTMAPRGVFRIAAIGFVALAILAQMAVYLYEFPRLSVTNLTLTGVCLALILYVVALRVYGEGPVTAQRIQGAVALYLLIAAFFAVLYELLENVSPGAFRFPEGWRPTGGDFSDVLSYFSFVTLTTVGYGDVTAVHPFARSLVMFEALIGQLYPAILLARLVTLYEETRRLGKNRGGGKTPSRN
jgi:Ion channel